MKPWWSTRLGTMERFHCASVPFHFFEAARMFNASRLLARQHYFAGITYRLIRRSNVHQILRTLYWPNDWPAYNGNRQVEWYGEMRFESQRRLGRKMNLSAADFDFAMEIDNASQTRRALQHEPVASTAAQANRYNHLTKEEAVEQNNLAILVAMRLLALCCPNDMPKATLQNVKDLVERSHAWCKSHPEISRV